METKGRHTLQCIDVARAGLGEPARQSGKELLWRCPHSEQHNHGDRNPSLGVNPEKNVWKCWSEGVGGKGGWSFAAFIAGVDANDKPAVTAWLREHGLLSGSGGAVGEVAKGRARRKATEEREVAQYNYTDEEGDLLFQVVRYEPKNFRQRRPDGNDGWVWHLECDAKCKCKVKLPPARRVLYKLPELEKVPRAWKRSGLITILEPTSPQQEAEEKRIIEAWIPNLPYVLVVEGEKDVAAAEALGFTATCNPMGAKKWRDEYSQFLEGSRVVIIADADRAGREHAQQVAASLQGWAASVKVINNLPGPNVKDLSNFAALSWPNGPAECKQALLNVCSDAPEWKPASGAELLDTAYNYIRRFAKVSEAQARALTLWVAHTFICRGWGHTPYLHIYSAERGEGKSTVVDVVRALLGVPTVLIRPSLAALYSDVTENPGQPQLIDEIDKMFTGRNEHDSEIYAYLNAGFQRGRTVPRVNFIGRKRITERFETFCPKVLAGRYEETLDDATRDRCIGIRMEKAAWADHVKRWVEKFHLAEGQEIGTKLSVWCESIAEEAWKADVWCTTAVGQRVIDIWEPLLAIAELAGGNWLEWAKSALIELSTGSRAEHDSRGVKLLKDIRAVRDARAPSESIFSTDLAAALAAMREEWAEYGRAQKPISSTQIARLLARYEIKSVQVWIGGKNLHGYYWTQFEKAWETYLSRDAAASGRASASLADSSVSESTPIPSENQEVGRIPSVLASTVDPDKKAKEKGIEWFRLSELRAMGWGKTKGHAWKPWKDRPSGLSAGTGLPRLTVNGHETASLDTSYLESRPTQIDRAERATVNTSGIEKRGK